jgi:hypothetical protein
MAGQAKSPFGKKISSDFAQDPAECPKIFGENFRASYEAG